MIKVTKRKGQVCFNSRILTWRKLEFIISLRAERTYYLDKKMKNPLAHILPKANIVFVIDWYQCQTWFL